MPLLSFVVTCYNLEIYINDCINSIIFQFASDVEIIIINDASTDGSFEICNQIQINNQSLVKLIHLDNNVGPGVARNIGLAEARGQYIYFLDGDDTLAFNSIGRIGETIQRCDHPDIIRVGTIHSLGDTTLSISTHLNASFNHHIYKAKEFFELFLKNDRVGFNVWEFIFKRAFLNRNKLKFSNLRVWEDSEFLCRALFLTAKISIDNSIFLIWKIRSSSKSLTSSHDIFWSEIIRAAILIARNIGKSNSNYKNNFLIKYVDSCLMEFETVSNLIVADSYKEYMHLFEVLFNNIELLQVIVRPGRLLWFLRHEGPSDGLASFLNNRLDALRRIFQNENKNLYAFPATRRSVLFLNYGRLLELNSIALLDNDILKKGLVLDGYKVVHPNEFLKKRDGFILICSQSAQTAKNFSEYLEKHKLIIKNNFTIVPLVFF